MSELQQALSEIQRTLKAPKNQFNKFGGYAYRNCEDILEAVKPLLGQCILTVSDEMIAVGDRVYVKATATISLGTESISTTANAREAQQRKGMDDSQLTGATSSYARKYALNGLFCIDDTKDADSGNNNSSSAQPLDPDMDLIVDAIKRKDAVWVGQNWQGLIAKCWANLNPQQMDTLNKMVNGI